MTVHVSIHNPRVNNVHPPQDTGVRVVSLNNGYVYDNSTSLIFASDDAAIAFGRAIVAAVLNAQDDERTKARLEYLRGEIQAQRISMSEIAELQSLTPWIDRGDVELLEWAGVPEK